MFIRMPLLRIQLNLVMRKKDFNVENSTQLYATEYQYFGKNRTYINPN